MIPEQYKHLFRQPAKFDRALVTASYFGFQPIISPKVTEQDVALTRHCGSHPHYDAAEKLAVMKMCLGKNLSTPADHLSLIYKKQTRSGYGLHFVGSNSGLAEATLIRTTISILSEEGHKNLSLNINCIGDRESINTYERELAQHIRKFGVSLPDDLKQNIKKDIFNIFRLDNPELKNLSETAPSAINFLSAESRLYFKEVLEYLEALGIEFYLHPALVGERNHVSHTIFAIKNGVEGQETLALGYRYSQLSRCLGLRRDVPMAGVTIFPKALNIRKTVLYKDLPKPKFYLIQLGQEAKVKTLSLIELLRTHRIPVYHFLDKDKLAVQISNAENLHVSHLIIIGQKEALDKTATVRNITTRAQETVPMINLPLYLKTITL